MNNKDFKQFILEVASKYLEANPEKATVDKSQDDDMDITAEQIGILAEEMKRINKKIDLRNPLINPDFFEKMKKETKEKPLVNEGQKQRWQNLYNYSVPNDEKR